jgi:hypothetical protein
MTTRALMVPFLVMPLTTGCMRGQDKAAPESTRAAAPPATFVAAQGAAPAEAARLAEGAAGKLGAPGGQAPAKPAGLAAMAAARKLIRTAQITVEVAGFEEAAKRVGALADSLGGYLADSQTTRGNQDRLQGTITIRVPAEAFAQAVAGIKALGRVRLENVAAQDVTKAYTDLETRLGVKRQTAARLTELLRNRTADLDDILSAERELARITEEIETLEGERRFYDQQVALSTITVTMHEPAALVEPGAFAPIGNAFKESAELLANSVAALIYAAVALLPWLLVAFVAWKVFRAVRRRRAKKAEEPARAA